MNNINLSNLEENLGVKIVFLLALASTFLGLYITLADIFGHKNTSNTREVKVISLTIKSF